MRIFTVPKLFYVIKTYFECVFICIKIVEYGSVVMRRHIKGFYCKSLAIFKACKPLILRNKLKKFRIVINRGYTYNIPEILCRCPDKGYASNIYFFNNFFICSSRGNGFFKWIKIYNNYIYLRYMVFG